MESIGTVNLRTFNPPKLLTADYQLLQKLQNDSQLNDALFYKGVYFLNSSRNGRAHEDVKYLLCRCDGAVLGEWNITDMEPEELEARLEGLRDIAKNPLDKVIDIDSIIEQEPTFDASVTVSLRLTDELFIDPMIHYVDAPLIIESRCSKVSRIENGEVSIEFRVRMPLAAREDALRDSVGDSLFVVGGGKRVKPLAVRPALPHIHARLSQLMNSGKTNKHARKADEYAADIAQTILDQIISGSITETRNGEIQTISGTHAFMSWGQGPNRPMQYISSEGRPGICLYLRGRVHTGPVLIEYTKDLYNVELWKDERFSWLPINQQQRFSCYVAINKLGTLVRSEEGLYDDQLTPAIDSWVESGPPEIDTKYMTMGAS